MRRLFAKELRERRVWFILLAGLLWLGVVSGVLTPCFAPIETGITTGFGIELDWDVWEPWNSPAVMVLALICLPMGLGAFASELTGNRAHFLFAAPVSWKKVAAAKLVAGIVGIVAIACASGLLYWLMLPGPYQPHADWSHIGLGAAGLSAIGIGFYLLGILVSPVLPGVFGSALVMAVLALGGTIVGMTFEYYGTKSLFWPVIGWLLGILTGALVITRFGLTLPTQTRLTRFALCVLGALAVLSPIGFFTSLPRVFSTEQVPEVSFGPAIRPGSYSMPPPPLEEPSRYPWEKYAYCSVSPDGSTAMIGYERTDNWSLLVNLDTGRQARIEAVTPKRRMWEGSLRDAAYVSLWLGPNVRLRIYGGTLETLQLSRGGQLVRTATHLPLPDNELVSRAVQMSKPGWILLRTHIATTVNEKWHTHYGKLIVDTLHQRTARLVTARQSPGGTRLDELATETPTAWVTATDLEEAGLAISMTFRESPGWSEIDLL